MNKITTYILCLLVTICSSTACLVYGADDVNATDLLKAYPAAANGQQRVVIHLKELPNEEDHLVELIIGKEIEVDCNKQFFAGQLEEKTIPGWGYDYYIVPKISGPLSTLMACQETKKSTAFVTLRKGDTGALKRYNSKLPLVIYIPKGFEVRYRIWNADNAIQKATLK